MIRNKEVDDTDQEERSLDLSAIAKLLAITGFF